MESCSPTADVELPTSPPHNHPEKKNRQPQTVPPTNYNNKLWTVTCLKGIMGKCISKYHYSGTPLIRPPTGHKNLVVLTGWSY